MERRMKHYDEYDNPHVEKAQDRGIGKRVRDTIVHATDESVTAHGLEDVAERASDIRVLRVARHHPECAAWFEVVEKRDSPALRLTEAGHQAQVDDEYSYHPEREATNPTVHNEVRADD